MKRWTWSITPHDPLVLGTGRRGPSVFPRMVHRVPLPATLAGAARARFVKGRSDLSVAEAQALLDAIELKGPWLQRGDAVLVPAPQHLRAHDPTTPRARAPGDTITLVAPSRMPLEQGEGVFTPAHASGLLRWEKPADAHKLRPLDGFVALDTAVDMLIGARTSVCRHEVESAAIFEARVHVSIDVESQTAARSALYSSSGVRYADDVTLNVDVTALDDRAASDERLFVLGGESRVVSLTQREGQGFPAFSAVRERYRRAIDAHRGDGCSLLLMLVTPASFSTEQRFTTGNRAVEATPGWIPSWLHDGVGEVPGLAGVKLRLHSLAFERYAAMSGWSMAYRDGGQWQGRQRAVRRLVPAGSVFVLDFEAGKEKLLEVCERFWGRAIDEGVPGDSAALLAAPHRDGYGMVIPGLLWSEGEAR